MYGVVEKKVPGFGDELFRSSNDSKIKMESKFSDFFPF